jgi:mono/diheme cytochrome c family protein
MMERRWSGQRRVGVVLAGTILVLLVAAGGRGWPSRQPPIHLNPNMDDQPKYRPQAPSLFFASGSTSQAPTGATIARGDLRENSALFSGRSAFGSFVSNPLPVDSVLVARGRERFDIYCRPCHGDSGDGHGALYRQSKVEARNLHDDRIKEIPDGQIFDVITNGAGLMQGYRFPIPVRDRWAIVAYVRELQARGLPQKEVE